MSEIIKQFNQLEPEIPERESLGNEKVRSLVEDISPELDKSGKEGNESEILEQKTSEKNGKKYLKKQKTGLTEKMKDFFEILKPHGWHETASKLIGAYNSILGLGMTVRPEMMGVNPETELLVRFLGVGFTLFGSFVFTTGIYEAIENIRVEKESKEWKKERKKKEEK